MPKTPRPFSSYSLVVFDLDGTLSPSKSALTADMADVLLKLLGKIKVAVISGGGYPQFQVQFLQNLPSSSQSFSNLFILPTSGTRFYIWRSTWNEIYAEHLTPIEKEKVVTSLKEALDVTCFNPANKIYGDLIEDRGSQITFSALGQSAPLGLKETWDPDRSKRQKIVDIIKAKIPEFDVRIGGSTSIDITKRGINKAFGIRKLEEYLKLGPEQILFVGDALFQGGNDFPAKATGVDCVQVSGPEETKTLIEGWLI